MSSTSLRESEDCLELDKEQIKQALANIQYKEPEEISKAILQVSTKYPELKPELNAFDYNNGTYRPLMSMTGTVPIEFKETPYNIPLVIWIPTSYPSKEPMVFVKPSPTMPIKRNKLYFIGLDGNISLASLRMVKQGTFHVKWSPLLELVDGLVSVFKIQAPVNLQPSEESCSSSTLQTLPSRTVLQTPCNVLPNKEALMDALVSFHYNNVEQTLHAILETTQAYNLQPILDNYVFNNGTQETLLNMTGTIPIWHGGMSYNIPIVIWVPNARNTLGRIKVFVKPKTETPIAQYGLDFEENNWEVKDFKCTRLMWAWIFSPGFKRLILALIESFSKLPPIRLVHLGSKRALPNLTVDETATNSAEGSGGSAPKSLTQTPKPEPVSASTAVKKAEGETNRLSIGSSNPKDIACIPEASQSQRIKFSDNDTPKGAKHLRNEKRKMFRRNEVDEESPGKSTGMGSNARRPSMSKKLRRKRPTPSTLDTVTRLKIRYFQRL